MKEGTLSVMVYHGSSRHSSLHKFHSHDVVITTLNTLTTDFGLLSKAEGISGSENNGKNVDDVILRNQIKEQIFSRNFHRIILDEAHNIRNRESISFKAMTRIRVPPIASLHPFICVYIYINSRYKYDLLRFVIY